MMREWLCRDQRAVSLLTQKSLKRHDLSQFYMLATSVVGAAHIADPAAGLFATSSTERRRDYLRLHASHT
jgi:hypothetical protein